MAEMGSALAALDFAAAHEEAVAGPGFDAVLVYGCGETWPPSSRIKLSLRTEQVVAATNALVNAGLMVVPVLLPCRSISFSRLATLIPTF
jgi:hypothetical protein